MSRWWPSSVELCIDAAAPEALAQQLAPAAFKPGTRVRAIVADGLLHYRIVPWSKEFSSPAARQSFAQHCFVDTFGDAARQWLVRIDTARYGRAALACAIDRTVLSGIEAAMVARGLRLTRLQPMLMAEFNRRRRHIDSRDHWFVLRHAAGMTLLLVQDGQPRHVKSVSGAHQDLAPILDREWFALGIEARHCPVFVAEHGAPDQARRIEPASTHWSMRWLVGDLSAVV